MVMEMCLMFNSNASTCSLACQCTAPVCVNLQLQTKQWHQKFRYAIQLGFLMSALHSHVLTACSLAPEKPASQQVHGVERPP